MNSQSADTFSPPPQPDCFYHAAKIWLFDGTNLWLCRILQGFYLRLYSPKNSSKNLTFDDWQLQFMFLGHASALRAKHDNRFNSSFVEFAFQCPVNDLLPQFTEILVFPMKCYQYMLTSDQNIKTRSKLKSPNACYR